MARRTATPQKLAPIRRPRQHGTGSITVDEQRGCYFANYREVGTGAQRRRAFASEDRAHVFLNEWFAEYSAWRLATKEQRAGAGPQVARPPEVRAARRRTFGDVIDAWELARAGELAHGTWRNYGPALNGLRGALGDIAVDQLTADDLIMYRAARAAGRDPRRPKEPMRKLAPTTLNQHLDRAEDVLRWGAMRGYVTENVATEIGKLRVEEFEPVVVGEAEIAALVAATAAKHRASMLMLGQLGLRIGEALGFPIAGWNAAANELHVTQQVIEERPGYVPRLSAPKSRYGRRTLIASAQLAEEIAASIERADGRPNQYGLLSPARNGAIPRYRNWVRDVWAPAVERAGLSGRGLTPHSLRHSRLSLMAASGKVPLVALSRFAGHHSVAFTLRRYGDHFADAGVSPDLYLTTAG